MEENKKDSHKGFKIFILLFIIASLFLFKKENQEKLMGALNSIGGQEKILKLVDKLGNEGNILSLNVYDDSIVSLKDNKLLFRELDGNIIMEKEFNFENLYVYYGEKDIYAIDKSTGDTYFLDKQGQTVNKLQINKEIFSFKESNQNLIYHMKSENEENIDLLNKEGIQVGNYSYENTNVLTYSTNKNATKSAVASLHINGGSIQSKIDYYGEKNEKIYEVDIIGGIVVYLGLTPKDDIVALTDNGLYFIKDGEIIWEKKFDLIKDIYIGNGNISILYSNYLETIDYSGRTESKIGFAEEYKKILPFGKGFLLYGDSNIVIVEGDKQILKHDESIIQVSHNKENIFVLGPEGIKTYIIDNK